MTYSTDAEKETCDRLKEARAKKGSWKIDFQEAYFFSDPRRMGSVTSEQALPATPSADAPDLNTDLGMELVTDYVTEIVNTYMPEHLEWCESARGMYIPADIWDTIVNQVKADDKQVFEAIKSSNFYTELSKAYRPDLAIGTAVLWIDAGRLPAAPIRALAVPLREFDGALGPEGEIDDRFVTRHVRNCDVKHQVGADVYKEIPKKERDIIEQNPAQTTQITWGFWRDWDDESDEVWRYRILLKGKTLIHQSDLRGAGSCPCVPARFNPNADWPWGVGPLLQGAPSLRQVDELERQRIEHAELSMNPPIAFPHDSYTAIEEGLEAGMAYPIQLGSQDAIKPIYDPPPANAANYIYDEKEKRLRRLFFVGFPEQTGDTPPTLGQWLDEMARAQRRIGTSGLPFWREGPAQYFQRFKFLLQQKGAIQPLTAKGFAGIVSTRPVNPTQRAAEQQEIATAVQGLQLMGQFFPEEFKMWVDGKQTMFNFLKKMRIELVAFRKPEQVNAAVNQIGQLLQSGAVAPPKLNGAGAPAPAMAA